MNKLPWSTAHDIAAFILIFLSIIGIKHKSPMIITYSTLVWNIVGIINTLFL